MARVRAVRGRGRAPGLHLLEGSEVAPRRSLRPRGGLPLQLPLGAPQRRCARLYRRQRHAVGGARHHQEPLAAAAAAAVGAVACGRHALGRRGPVCGLRRPPRGRRDDADPAAAGGVPISNGRAGQRRLPPRAPRAGRRLKQPQQCARFAARHPQRAQRGRARGDARAQARGEPRVGRAGGAHEVERGKHHRRLRVAAVRFYIHHIVRPRVHTRCRGLHVLCRHRCAAHREHVPDSKVYGKLTNSRSSSQCSRVTTMAGDGRDCISPAGRVGAGLPPGRRSCRPPPHRRTAHQLLPCQQRRGSYSYITLSWSACASLPRCGACKNVTASRAT